MKISFYFHSAILIATVLWLLVASIFGYYFFGWFPLATFCSFLLVLFFVQPLFEFIQVVFFQLFTQRKWRFELQRDSILLFRFELTGDNSPKTALAIRWIVFLVVLAPIVVIEVTMKGPHLIFALMTQLLWLCASSEDFRRL